MKKLLILILLSAIISGCKKEKVEPLSPEMQKSFRDKLIM